MDYVFDFMRMLGSGTPSRGGRGRRGRAGIGLQLRLVVLGCLLGLSWPMMRQIDWSHALPAGLKVHWPTGFGVEWPAGRLGLPDGWGRSVVPDAVPVPVPGAKPGVSAHFTVCGSGKRIDCVVDGDTFWMAGTKIRIADIDTPETHPPRCAAEARAGKRATERLQGLLNAGPVTLVPIARDVDRYGRKLRLVERDGASLSAVLVREGLARHYGGGKRSPWCGVV